MIPASHLRVGLAALVCGLAAVAVAQEEPKQRSRTEPKRPETPAQTQPAPQRGVTPTTAQKLPPPATPQKAAAPASSQKPAAGAPAKGATPGTGKPDAAGQANTGAVGPTGPGGGKATLLASFNDWGAYASGDGRTRVCYALSTPKERLPKDLKRDPAYLFVSFRPADNVRNEIAVVLGFATRDGGEAEAVVGQSTYALVTKGTNAWIRNTAEESQVIAAFSKGQSVTVKATSGRGNASTDRYSLTGFGPALDRARKECS